MLDNLCKLPDWCILCPILITQKPLNRALSPCESILTFYQNLTQLTEPNGCKSSLKSSVRKWMSALKAVYQKASLKYPNVCVMVSTLRCLINVRRTFNNFKVFLPTIAFLLGTVRLLNLSEL